MFSFFDCLTIPSYNKTQVFVIVLPTKLNCSIQFLVRWSKFLHTHFKISMENNGSCLTWTVTCLLLFFLLLLQQSDPAINILNKKKEKTIQLSRRDVQYSGGYISECPFLSNELYPMKKQRCCRCGRYSFVKMELFFDGLQSD